MLWGSKSCRRRGGVHFAVFIKGEGRRIDCVDSDISVQVDTLTSDTS